MLHTEFQKGHFILSPVRHLSQESNLGMSYFVLFFAKKSKNYGKIKGDIDFNSPP